MNTFKLVRHEDETGISGVGEVAEGVVFEDGTVAMRWLTDTSSTALYSSIGDVVKIHGHGGKTHVRYDENSYPAPWQTWSFKGGPQGRAVCEALGLDPKTVLERDLYALPGTRNVHINYTGATIVTKEQWEKALEVLDPEPEPVG